MPMEVYLDESGIQSGSKRCVVAGYSGGRRKFEGMEDCWNKLLVSSGIPLSQGFHAKQFFSRDSKGRRRGLYQEWSDAMMENFIDRAAQLLRNHRLRPVGGAVTMAKWNELPRYIRRYLTGGAFDDTKRKWVTSGAPSRPYFFAFHHAIIAGCEDAKSGVTVDFICDQQAEYAGLALNTWKRLKEKPGFETAKHMGGIAFYSRFERPCLQAADFLAYCAHHVDKYALGSDRADIAYALHQLNLPEVRLKDLDDTLTQLLPSCPDWLKEIDEKQFGRVR